MTAESVQQVEQALEKLQIYDRAQHVFPCWRSAAKTFDDWRWVLHGEAVHQFWKLHQVSLPEIADCNVHMTCLCFLCSVSARWGPCEHMYTTLLHEGKINRSALPVPKARGRPRADAQKQALLHEPPLIPGPSRQGAPATSTPASL